MAQKGKTKPMVLWVLSWKSISYKIGHSHKESPDRNLMTVVLVALTNKYTWAQEWGLHDYILKR